MPLGIEGFTYADLHLASRLGDLYEVFCRQVEASDPQFWAEWDAYRAAPDAPRTPQQRSELIVRMAPHVSRFVATLFAVEDAVGAINAQTTALDVLFRFKADFVRKRALPLVKGGAHVALDPADVAVVEELARPWAHLDREQAIASAGCALLDREVTARSSGTDEEKAAVAAQADALKRWCAACLHDPGYRPWVIFRFPETLDYMTADERVELHGSGRTSTAPANCSCCRTRSRPPVARLWRCVPTASTSDRSRRSSGWAQRRTASSATTRCARTGRRATR